MEPRLQRRVQRYGWDLAAAEYDVLWQAQLAPAQARLLDCAALQPGERVLDVACGTGRVAFVAAKTVGPSGRVVGVDLSDRMVSAATRRAVELGRANASFARMDAEALDLPDTGFDVVLCALGLMYMPDPEQALREMRRMVRPGGRVVLAVWGAARACGWSAVFPIIDAEVASEVCPLFFRLGNGDALEQACAAAGLERVTLQRLATTLDYADVDIACDAAFVGGPVALAWSRFDAEARARVRRRYAEAINAWQDKAGVRIPAEFVLVSAAAPGVPKTT